MAIHLFVLEICVAIISKFFLLSYFIMSFKKKVIGSLSRVSSMECHQSF